MRELLQGLGQAPCAFIASAAQRDRIRGLEACGCGAAKSYTVYLLYMKQIKLKFDEIK